MADVMTPEHPRWQEFMDALEGPEGCDFREKIPGDPKTATWKCKGGTDKSFATAILKKMGGFDIEASLSYFKAHGGYCDCEIVFNVE